MADGLTTTFRYLARIENEAALEILLAALEAPVPAIRQHATLALLDRRSPQGHQEVFRRLPRMPAAERQAAMQRADRLAAVAAAALRSDDPGACRATCEIIRELRLYDTIAALTAAVEQVDETTQEAIAETILALADALYGELSGGEQPKRKNLDALRLKLTATLEDAARKFHRHRRSEIIEALLLLAKPSNVTVRHLLSRSDEAGHEPLVALLTGSQRGGVIRLLLGLLEETQPPLAFVRVLGARVDMRFIEHLLRHLSNRLSKTAAENLLRLDAIAWAKPGHEVFAQLSPAAQAGAVALINASNIDRNETFAVYSYLMLEGKPAGRCAALTAIGDLRGAKADELVLRAMHDRDPNVRAAAIPLLRPRKIEAALSHLIRAADCSDPAVRAALREALPEFSLQRFLCNFETLDADARAIAGSLIRRIDDRVGDTLAAEMKGLSPVRRRRAVLAAAAMGITKELEQEIIKLLTDDDHMVRVAAARALAECQSVPSWEALRDALLDRSFLVKEAAEQSLELISNSLLGPAEAAEPAEVNR